MSLTDNSENGNGKIAPAKLGDFFAAWMLLTRVPLPNVTPYDASRGAASAWAFPLVGLVLGAIAGLVLWAMIGIGIHSGIAAALAIGFMMLLTGALHEDGLSDTADGLGGGRDRLGKLAIMRDSRIGAYGMAALCISVLARWAALAALADVAPVAAMMLAGAVSRMPMVLVMAAMPPARSDGLSVGYGRPGRVQALIAFGIAVLAALVLSGVLGIAVVLIALLAAVPVIFWASRGIGGQTGDVLGAVQQCAEIAVLALATAIYL